ncbi:MAG TPA: SRPBCC domain-containing protein [Actinocrinis sp.]|uniref:SRPBCC family protein n=1 Tax=Actinocrinis sp. TaxID=1920516 RepID=UPI002D436ACC|nr:SRPBCC domain-containing protein [Actinocrinis sp.]HZU56113.1 SRPBCC domain-containing protein [Actinocrinis sp.]
MSEYRIVREYQHPVITVWRALTDPALIPLWTSTGRGGRPEGFKAEAGTKFRFIGKPFPGWDGIVRCEVLDAEEPTLLRYDWRNKEADEPSVVTNMLEAIPGGTRLTWEHTGFRGIEGVFMSRLLGRVRRTMLDEGLPPVLADIGEDGALRPGSTLRAKG